MKNESVLRLENISKVFTFKRTKNQILEGVNLDLAYGDFITIQGKSGTGKSTLLNIISGIIKATSGKVFLDGKNMSRPFDPTIAHHRGKTIGFVFQSFNLIRYQTALENVMAPLHFHTESRLNHRDQAIDALKAVDLEDKLYYYPDKLSGGQMQRVAIARAMVKKPKLIIADEPTGNLDDETSMEIINIFKKLNKEQKITFIIVTHDEHITTCANKKYILKNKNLHLIP